MERVQSDRLFLQRVYPAVDGIHQRGQAAQLLRLIAVGQIRVHRLFGGGSGGKVGDIALHRRQDLLAGHVHHGQRLDADGLAVVLQLYLVAGAQLGLRVDLVGHQHVHVLLLQQHGDGVRRCPQVQQAALFGGLPDPCVIVAVAVEDDTLVGLDGALDQIVQRGGQVVRPLQLVGEQAQGLGHRGVQHDIGAGDGVAGAQHAELELVASEGEGRGPVAVGGVTDKARQHIRAQLHPFLLHAAVGRIRLDGLQNAGQLIAQKDGDHGGRRFVGSQPVVVAGGGHGGAQQPLIIVHGLDHRHKEQQELRVLVGRLARGQQIDAGVGGDGPVIVLAAAVDAGKGLLMEQAHQTVLGGHPLHNLHGQLVVVGGNVGGGVDGGQLMLGGRHLVVLRLGQDAQLPKLLVQLLHIGGHAGLDGAEVVVVQLLPLGGPCAEQRPAGVDQVAALVVHGLVDEEVLLLRAHGGGHAPHVVMAEQLQDAQRLLVEGLHAPQQGRFLVQRLAAVGAEGRGDTEGLALDKGVAGGIPRRVAPGLEGGAQAAGGEGGGIRLALDELLAGELHQHPAIGGGGDEAIVLFGGDTGQRLEPVGEVGRAVLDCPVLHGRGDSIGHGGVELGPLLDGVLQGTIYICGQTGLHDAAVKNQASEVFRYSQHSRASFQKK